MQRQSTTGRFKRPPEQELRTLYLDQRLTTRAIAKLYDTDHQTVGEWLERYGIQRRAANRGLENRGIEAPSREVLYDLVHVQYLTYAKIAAMYGVDLSAIPHWLKKHGIARPTVWASRHRGNPPRLPDRAALQGLYVDQALSLREISRLVGVDSSQIVNRCREYGIPLRHDDGWDGGLRRMCTDGHLVRSIYEQRVDDWLTVRHIAHVYEPRLPFDLRFRADFLASGWYIEIWGVTKMPSYTARAKHKRALYVAHNTPLIELHPHSFDRSHKRLWERTLSAKLGGVVRGASEVQQGLFS